MRACIQRAKNASVILPGSYDEMLPNNELRPMVAGRITTGLLILLGVGQGDTEREARFLAKKCSELRIFEDETGKMNLSVKDIGGSVLVVSQFTLYADCRKGRRPSFTMAASPPEADRLYRLFCDVVREQGIQVGTGVFQAEMHVELVNDGPVTIWLDTAELLGKSV